MNNRFILLILLLLLTLSLKGQDTLGYEKIDTQTDIAFVKSTGEAFSGIVQSRKRNGRVPFEFEFDEGIVKTQYVYYTTKKKNRKLAAKVIYHPKKPWLELTQIRYLSKFEEWTHYDEQGKRTLKEHRKDGEIIYSCEYTGRKKHGQEMWLNDDGTKLFYQYVNGKEKK